MRQDIAVVCRIELHAWARKWHAYDARLRETRATGDERAHAPPGGGMGIDKA